MLLRKSRINWLKEGDKNTRFFHQAIQKRRARNKITHLNQDGQVITSPNGIKQILTDHFSSLFSRRDTGNLFKIPPGYYNSLLEDEKLGLEESISVEEVTLALRQSSDTKAPGPDGINFGVIKEV